MKSFVVCLGIVLLSCLCAITEAATNPWAGPTFDSNNFCDVTARQLKLRIKETNAKRITCEGSSFKSSDCSNYWALAQDLLEESVQFQKCLSHQVSAFRGWATGLDLSGGFVLATAAGDRAEVDLQANITDTAALAEAAMIDGTFAASEQDKRTRLSQAHKTNLDATTAMSQADFVATTTADSQSEQDDRQHIDDEHSQTLAWLLTETTATLSAELTDASQERSDVQVTSDMSVTNIRMQERSTRALVDADAATVRSVMSTESQNTRAEYDLQTVNVNNTFQAANLNTRNVVVNNYTRDTANIQALVVSTQTAIRAEHLSQTNQDIQEIDQQQQIVRNTVGAAIDVQAVLTQNADSVAESTVQQASADSNSQITTASGTSTQTIVAAEVAAATTLSGSVSQADADVDNLVFSEEAQTAVLFNLLLGQTNFSQITSDDEAALFSTIFAHLHLCLQNNDPRVNFYIYEDLVVSRGVVWATIQYWQRKLGSTASVTAAINYYNQGTATTDTRNAMGYFRSAYNAVVSATM